MGFLRLLFVPEAVCTLKLNSSHFWHASSVHIISLADCVFLLWFFSLYIYVFIYLYSETPRMHIEFCGVTVAMFSPALPWIILSHQGVEGIWARCLRRSSPVLVSAAVVWGFSRSLLIYLWVLWPILDTSEGCGKSWWGSSSLFSWCPALPLP